MRPDVICFSHLRWEFVFQRPNHLMSRAARDRRVFYVEEPELAPGIEPGLRTRLSHGVLVVTPQLPDDIPDLLREQALRALVDDLVREQAIERPLLWYCTPMALPWSRHLAGAATVYDCMDHLAGFRGAPTSLTRLEADLMARADLLLTGGMQLHRLKSRSHSNAHCFPSSVDVAHFARARELDEAADQVDVPRPRLGYAGVIDERLDMEVIAGLAAARPDWSIVLVGPLAKIDQADVPAGPNIHLLGGRPYDALPAYMAGWDVGIMPFAHNEATRYISPTKTPEYLAAGLRVASTSIRDVVEPYGDVGLVEIGDGPQGFLAAAQRAARTPRASHRARADRFLAGRSWDATWEAIDGLIAKVLSRRRPDLLQRRLTTPLPAPLAPQAALTGGVVKLPRASAPLPALVE